MKNLFNTNFVLGEGPVPCKVMFIGEAPGKEEDEQGRPFCGASGKKLNRLMEAAGIKRSEVYITNAVKQRPPNNRKPTIQEIKSHRKYLKSEIQKVSPIYIVTLGKTALESTLNRQIDALNFYLNRTIILKSKIQVIPTYHPAALLRNANYLSQIQKTLRLVKALI